LEAGHSESSKRKRRVPSHF